MDRPGLEYLKKEEFMHTYGNQSNSPQCQSTIDEQPILTRSHESQCDAVEYRKTQNMLLLCGRGSVRSSRSFDMNHDAFSNGIKPNEPKKRALLRGITFCEMDKVHNIPSLSYEFNKNRAPEFRGSECRSISHESTYFRKSRKSTKFLDDSSDASCKGNKRDESDDSERVRHSNRRRKGFNSFKCIPSYNQSLGLYTENFSSSRAHAYSEFEKSAHNENIGEYYHRPYQMRMACSKRNIGRMVANLMSDVDVKGSDAMEWDDDGQILSHLHEESRTWFPKSDLWEALKADKNMFSERVKGLRDKVTGRFRLGGSFSYILMIIAATQNSVLPPGIPYEIIRSGGSAYGPLIVIYAFFCCVPLIATDMALGRGTQGSILSVFESLNKRLRGLAIATAIFSLIWSFSYFSYGTTHIMILLTSFLRMPEWVGAAKSISACLNIPEHACSNNPSCKWIDIKEMCISAKGDVSQHLVENYPVLNFISLFLLFGITIYFIVKGAPSVMKVAAPSVPFWLIGFPSLFVTAIDTKQNLFPKIVTSCDDKKYCWRNFVAISRLAPLTIYLPGDGVVMTLSSYDEPKHNVIFLATIFFILKAFLVCYMAVLVKIADSLIFGKTARDKFIPRWAFWMALGNTEEGHPNQSDVFTTLKEILALLLARTWPLTCAASIIFFAFSAIYVILMIWSRLNVLWCLASEAPLCKRRKNPSDGQLQLEKSNDESFHTNEIEENNSNEHHLHHSRPLYSCDECCDPHEIQKHDLGAREDGEVQLFGALISYPFSSIRQRWKKNFNTTNAYFSGNESSTKGDLVNDELDKNVGDGVPLLSWTAPVVGGENNSNAGNETGVPASIVPEGISIMESRKACASSVNRNMPDEPAEIRLVMLLFVPLALTTILGQTLDARYNVTPQNTEIQNHSNVFFTLSGSYIQFMYISWIFGIQEQIKRVGSFLVIMCLCGTFSATVIAMVPNVACWNSFTYPEWTIPLLIWAFSTVYCMVRSGISLFCLSSYVHDRNALARILRSNDYQLCFAWNEAIRIKKQSVDETKMATGYSKNLSNIQSFTSASNETAKYARRHGNSITYDWNSNDKVDWASVSNLHYSGTMINPSGVRHCEMHFNQKEFKILYIFTNVVLSDLYWLFVGNIEMMRANFNMMFSRHSNKEFPFWWSVALKFVATPWLAREMGICALSFVSALKIDIVKTPITVGVVLFQHSVLWTIAFLGFLSPDIFQSLVPPRVIKWPKIWIHRLTLKFKVQFLDEFFPKMVETPRE